MSLIHSEQLFKRGQWLAPGSHQSSNQHCGLHSGEHCAVKMCCHPAPSAPFLSHFAVKSRRMSNALLTGGGQSFYSPSLTTNSFLLVLWRNVDWEQLLHIYSKSSTDPGLWQESVCQPSSVCVRHRWLSVQSKGQWDLKQEGNILDVPILFSARNFQFYFPQYIS